MEENKLNDIYLPKSVGIHSKLQILLNLYNKYEERIVHFDNLRQRNLHISLIIYAGLFGIGLKTTETIYLISIAIAMFLTMFIFWKIDRKFHERTHIYSDSTYDILRKMGEIKKAEDLAFKQSGMSYKEKLKFFSLHSTIYIIAMILSAGAFLLLNIFNQLNNE